MNNKGLEYLQNSLSSAGQMALYPFSYGTNGVSNTNLSGYISRVQFERMAHDVLMWRDSYREAELAYYPSRVKMQRMYMDTDESPYVMPAVNRLKELTLQRKYCVYQRKGGKIIESVDLSQALEDQSWIEDYIEYVIEADLFGYSLIELGDIVGDSFPFIKTTRRENIRPDGLLDNQSPILTSLVYMLDGVKITDDEQVRMFNHWIPTRPKRASSCGYGLYATLSLLEIHLRHIMEWNMDYVEMYGQPIKKGSTNKQGEDRDKFEEFLASSAANAYILLDKQMGDDVSYEMVKDAGTAWKSYPNIEERFQGRIDQLILGHTDAMKSSPGKLGGQQAANKDGFNESLIEQAMNSKQIKVGKRISRIINGVLAPNLRKIGKKYGSSIIKNLIPEGYEFKLLNDKEENEINRRTNSFRIGVSEYVKNLNDSGYNVDVKQLSDITGLTLTEAPPERKSLEERKNESIIERKDGEQ